MPTRTIMKSLAAGAIALGLIAPTVASAHDDGSSGSERSYHMARKKGDAALSRRHDRRDANEREYDRARAESVDPGGSYSAYPDWARYALSPKSTP